MDKTNRQFLVSALIDSSRYFSMPLHLRMSLLSRLVRGCPSRTPAERYCREEETAIGYESSWREIFPTHYGGD
ncbi:MAG TPA: hypothetical protein VFG09_12670 [Thermodesulfovibrionales bacterium]|nr:hypothetical protein [Thermodesulfovibrionales bacterium]